MVATQTMCNVEKDIYRLLVEGYLVKNVKLSDACYVALQALGPEIAGFVLEESNCQQRNKAQRLRLLRLAQDLRGIVEQAKDFTAQINTALMRCVGSMDTEVHLRAIRILSQVPKASGALIVEAFARQSEPKLCIRLLDSAAHLDSPDLMPRLTLHTMVIEARNENIRAAAAQLMAGLGPLQPYARSNQQVSDAQDKNDSQCNLKAGASPDSRLAVGCGRHLFV